MKENTGTAEHFVIICVHIPFRPVAIFKARPELDTTGFEIWLDSLPSPGHSLCRMLCSHFPSRMCGGSCISCHCSIGQTDSAALFDLVGARSIRCHQHKIWSSAKQKQKFIYFAWQWMKQRKNSRIVQKRYRVNQIYSKFPFQKTFCRKSQGVLEILNREKWRKNMNTQALFMCTHY